MRTLFISLAACLFAVAPAFGWNSTGHQMTAEIAFKQLSAEDQQRFAGILRSHPRYQQDFATAMPDQVRNGSQHDRALWLFQRASYWPDLVPGISDSVRDEFHRGTWHYINLPVYLTDDDERALDGKLQHNMSMTFEPLRPGLNVIQALEGNLRVWQDPAAPDAKKAVAFCWILHLAGDMHQPLHTVALFSRDYFPDGDRGGNSIRIAQQPETSNLHRVWDSLPDDFDDQEPSAETASMLAAETVSNASPPEWLQRHFKLALDYVYTPDLKRDLEATLADNPEGAVRLSADYRAAAGGIAKEQVIAAGHRIAALLTL